MRKKPTKDVSNLPDEFKEIFLQTTRQIRRSGDAIVLAGTAFLVAQIVFRVDFGEAERNSLAESFRGLVYEAFANNRQFLDTNIENLAMNGDDYIQSLYARGLIYLCTSLEILVKQLIATLIDFDSKVLAAQSLRKVKIPMAEFFGLGEDEKSSYLADLIIKDLDCGNQRGLNRIDCLLSAFELKPTLCDAHRKRILALHGLRNCIVHNDSIADARLCKQCGWLRFKIGDKITISRKDFRDYEKSILAYDNEIFYNLNKKLGAPQKFLITLRDTFDGLLSKDLGES